MLSVLRQRNFSLVWFGGLISMAGDWMLAIALPVYVYTLTRSTLQTSLMLMAAFIPRLALGSVAGVFADRWNRKRTMILMNVLLALGLIPLYLVHTPAQIWIVYLVQFVEAALAQFFAPAESALLPSLVGQDQLVAANALNGLNQNLSRLIGPALAGIVVGLTGLPGVVVCDAASFVVSAGLITLITVDGRPSPAAAAPLPAAHDPAVPAGSQPGRLARFAREWAEGLRVIVSSRVLSTLFLMGAATGVGEGIFSVLLVVFVSTVLHGGALQFGWLMSGQAIGGILGGVVIGALGPRVRPGRLLGWSTLCFGLLDLLIVNAPAALPLVAPAFASAALLPGITPAFVVVLALFVVVGIPGAGSGAGTDTLVQTAVPSHLLGRIFGFYMVVFALLILGGMTVAGTLGNTLGAVPLLNVQGSVYALAGLFALLRLRGKWAGERPGRGPTAAPHAELAPSVVPPLAGGDPPTQHS
jgi:MFS family permease